MRITVLAAAILTPDRNPDPLEGTAAGNWTLGIVEQSQGGTAGFWTHLSAPCTPDRGLHASLSTQVGTRSTLLIVVKKKKQDRFW